MKLKNESHAEPWNAKQKDERPETWEDRQIQNQEMLPPPKLITITQHRAYTWTIPIALIIVSIAGFFFGRMSKDGETLEAIVFLVVMLIVAISIQGLQRVQVACPVCGKTLKHRGKSSLARFVCDHCGFQAQ